MKNIRSILLLIACSGVILTGYHNAHHNISLSDEMKGFTFMVNGEKHDVQRALERYGDEHEVREDELNKFSIEEVEVLARDEDYNCYDVQFHKRDDNDNTTIMTSRIYRNDNKISYIEHLAMAPGIDNGEPINYDPTFYEEK